MSLRTYFINIFLFSLIVLPAAGQVADFDFEDPNNPLKNTANDNQPAIGINPFARITDGGVYTVPDPDRPDNHQNINFEVPLSLVNNLTSIYLEWEFRCQEESMWLMYTGENLNTGIYHSGSMGFRIRYYTEGDPGKLFDTGFEAPLIPPMKKGEKVKVAFYYNYFEGIAYLFLDNHQVWKSTDHGFAPTPEEKFFWNAEGDVLTIAEGANGDQSTTPSLYRFRIFDEACSDPVSPTIVESETIPEVCVGGSATLVASTGGQAGSYQWYTGSSPDDLSPVEMGQDSVLNVENLNTPGEFNYYVTFTDGPCESEPIAVTVRVNDRPAPPTAEEVQPSCGPGMFNLRVTGGQDGNFRWYKTDPSTDPSAEVIPEQTSGTFDTEELSQSQSYFVTVVDENGCESTPTEVVAEVKNIPPKPEVYPITPVCENDLQEVEITIVSQETGYVYNWYADQDKTQLLQGSTGPSLSIEVTKDTTIYVSSTNGSCESLETTRVDIEVVETPEIDAGEDVIILKGESIQLLASGEISTFHWEPALGLDRDDVMNPLASPQHTISYVVSGSNEAGCEVRDTVTVHVIDEFPVPNAFSPNQDNVNDVWEIPGNSNNTSGRFQSIDIQYPNCRIMVYNRWGNQVFYSEGYKEPWDGTFNGQTLDAGTYYYTLDFGDGKDPKKGTVTIMP